jgi:ABC-type glutathione transport system ATPase component
MDSERPRRTTPPARNTRKAEEHEQDVLVRGLRKSYRKSSQAVDGIDPDIETGEILALLARTEPGKPPR